MPVVNQSKIVEIKKGDSFNKITEKLLNQQIAINPLWFKLIAYRDGLINKLKVGEYELKKGFTMLDILALMGTGKSRQYAITLLEGWNFKQIFRAIQNNSYLKKTLTASDIKSFMTRLDTGYTHPEGLFFPDTYFFTKNTPDFAILNRAYSAMQLILQDEWKNRINDLPFKNSYQALILASIVEKETSIDAERFKIAGVFVRRLKKNMLLQTDPTVIYGMGERYKGNISYADLKRPTPYNTYVIRGLPPTPIAMPGRNSIHAVLHPDQGESLYFVANKSGGHVFSTTLRAHNNAVNKHQRKN